MTAEQIVTRMEQHERVRMKCYRPQPAKQLSVAIALSRWPSEMWVYTSRRTVGPTFEAAKKELE